VTGKTSFLVDCSSYQGVPAWAKAAAVCIGGAEKVTEGLHYVNPSWSASKAGLRQVAAHGFIPLAYLFMDATGQGAAQAQYFSSEAGDLTGFGIAVDFERAPDGSPTLAQAQDCAAELRRLYPGHPIGGYAPHWYAAGETLTFCDWLWASEYVNGSGDPALLYAQVPAAWWAPYGGKSPLLLQFTSSASVAGVSGPVDCSAFQGEAAQLAAIVLPAGRAPVKTTAVTTTQEAPVATPGTLIQLCPGGASVDIPVAAAVPGSDFQVIVAGGTGAVLTATAWFTDGSAAQQVTFVLHSGQAGSLVFRKPWSDVATVRLQRSDARASLGASAFVRF
jgi:GH25 family lysozyme M1 (1,4-beta-N-acetylmuramidase)